ncbi:MAG: beta-ketoacyl-[acyl-carrier-protein] synthase family protein [Candidatus Auribacterota bacterium]|jgi:3-oxoacyl-[acyl-carrier-protein] synthase II|nr:beta-ketoacyl-[acyl-carrier-protein] synthase family protein [Candidatus Auribacterota bacterium]
MIDFNREIWITGLGCVTPHGLDAKSFFRAVAAGVPCEQGGFAQRKFPVVYIDEENFLTRRISDKRSRIGKDYRRAYALEAAYRARHDAGLDDENSIGCTISCARPTLGRDQQWFNALECLRRGEDTSDFNVPIAGSVEVPGEYVFGRLALEGIALSTQGGCVTGLLSILTACRMIVQGQAERVLAGAVEVVPEKLFLAGYHSMKVLTESFEEFRPYHRLRNGFFISEGAGVVMLESAESAKKRGKKPYAVIEDWCSLADAHGMTSMDPKGITIKEIIKRLTKNGGISLDYINTHGTATRMNDQIESKAIYDVLGTKVPCSSIKPQTGHMLGASSVMEVIATALAVNQDIVPPTIRIDDTDIGYGLDYIPNQARSVCVKRAVSLSYGFGGVMAGILLKKYE